jgi:hypothetical protein
MRGWSAEEDWRMRKQVFYGTLLLIAAGLVEAAPQPAVVQRAGQWTLETRFEQPQQLVLPYGPTGQTRYWYMILTVTNRTGQDVDFRPKCELMTDTFQIVPAGVDVPSIVFDKIRERHQSRYPFLERLDNVKSRLVQNSDKTDVEGATNLLLQGQDNAKDFAVIWRDFDPRATAFKVFVAGLSNELAVINHPVAVDTDGDPLKVYLRKTLLLDYTLRGDPAIRSALEVVYRGKAWVMR